MSYKTNQVPALRPWTYTQPPPGMPGPPLWETGQQNVSLASIDPRSLYPGACRMETDNRWFVWVVNGDSSAFVEGNILSPIALSSNATISMSSDLLSLTGFSSLAPNKWRGGLAYFSAVSGGTADGSARRIVANTADTVYVERPFPVDLAANTATVQLYHPFIVRLAPKAGDIVQKIAGVSYGAITAEASSGIWAGGTSYGGWMQVTGLCDMVKVSAAVNNGSNNLTGPNASTGVAGEAESNATAASDDVHIFGHLPAGMGGSAYDAYVPAYLTNCLWG